MRFNHFIKTLFRFKKDPLFKRFFPPLKANVTTEVICYEHFVTDGTGTLETF